MLKKLLPLYYLNSLIATRYLEQMPFCMKCCITRPLSKICAQWRELTFAFLSGLHLFNPVFCSLGWWGGGEYCFDQGWATSGYSMYLMLALWLFHNWGRGAGETFPKSNKKDFIVSSQNLILLLALDVENIGPNLSLFPLQQLKDTRSWRGRKHDREL